MPFDEWYYADRTLKGAVYLTGLTLFVITLALFTPYWLQSVPDEHLPNPKFTNLGEHSGKRLSLLQSHTGCDSPRKVCGWCA